MSMNPHFACPPDAVFPQFPVQCRDANPQSLRRLFFPLVVVGECLEGGDDALPLRLVERPHRRRRGLDLFPRGEIAQFGWKVVDLPRLIVVQGVDHVLDAVLEFADVAGPVVFVENVQDIMRNPFRLLVEAPAIGGEKMRRQRLDVLPPLTERLYFPRE